MDSTAIVKTGPQHRIMALTSGSGAGGTGSTSCLPFSFAGGGRTLRRELMLFKEPISLLRLEGLSLVGGERCTSELVEFVNVRVEPKSSRLGSLFSLFSLSSGDVL